jgi:2-dehydro-3-deoxygluconokinase
MTKKIVCFGELLLRMSPALNRQWIHNASIPAYLGGAELNVATALARWNMPVQYFTTLPGNYMSQEICDELSCKRVSILLLLFFPAAGWAFIF